MQFFPSFPVFGISLFLCLLISVSKGSIHDIRYPRLNQRRDFNTSSTFAITNGTGLVPRLEIRQLQQNTIQWNLYLLALSQFQSMNQSTTSSYYQIAGIHGRPFVPWDSVQFAPGRTGGYCTHSSILFPIWHRPYVAIYEQVLWGIVQDVAATFTGDSQSDYIEAARSFRAPYWDWVAPAPRGQHTMPSSISSSAPVQVTTPNGTQTIPNPLYRYQFNPLDSTQLPDYPFNTWSNTLRYPTSNALNATNQDELITSQLDNNQASYSKRYLNLLQAYPTYAKFSNKAWLANVTNVGGSYDSLESIHDAIHGLIGNGGHMTYNEYSAFDPVFMLHHANVDRLFAIWQTIWPDTYIENSTATSGTATITPGDLITEDSPLTPFHSTSNGTFWTSATARDTTVFGYTYPEIADNNASCTIQAVNHLYGSTAGTPQNATVSKRHHQQLRVHERDGPQQPGTYYEWITNVRVAQDALDSTFTIFVFLGNFSSTPKNWQTDTALVGSHTVFMPFSSETQQNAGIIVAGTVPLTKELNENAAVGNYNTANNTGVETYLRDNLHWRVAKLTDNTEVSRDSLPSLKVSVVSCPVTEAESDYDFPNWGDCSTHVNITDGQPAGLQSGDPA